MDIYLSMKELLQKSSQYGGQVCQNFQLLAIYYLTQGMAAIDKHQKSIERKDTLKSKGRKVRYGINYVCKAVILHNSVKKKLRVKFCIFLLGLMGLVDFLFSVAKYSKWVLSFEVFLFTHFNLR